MRRWGGLLYSIESFRGRYLNFQRLISNVDGRGTLSPAYAVHLSGFIQTVAQ